MAVTDKGLFILFPEYFVWLGREVNMSFQFTSRHWMYAKYSI